MSERCEMDLSPGTRTRPASGGEAREVAGFRRSGDSVIFVNGLAGALSPAPRERQSTVP